MIREIEAPKSLVITKAFAARIAALPHIRRDRPLSAVRLEKHRAKVEADEFHSPSWAVATCLEDDIQYRVNGFHTSTLLAEEGQRIPDGLRAVIWTFECDTLADVAKLWSAFDSKDSVRGVKDIYKAYAGSCEALDSVNSNSLQAIVAGLGLSMDPNRSIGTKFSPTTKAEAMLREPEFCLWADTIVDGRDGRHLRRAPVTSAMFDTWKKNRSDAETFWRLVRTGDGASAKDPDRVLRELLLTTSVGFGGGSRHIKTMVQKEMYVRCIQLWNSFRKGERSGDTRYYPEAKPTKPV